MLIVLVVCSSRSCFRLVSICSRLVVAFRVLISVLRSSNLPTQVKHPPVLHMSIKLISILNMLKACRGENLSNVHLLGLYITEKYKNKVSQTWSKDHMYIKTTNLYRPYFTGPQGYTIHVIEPTYKDHLCIRTTFGFSLRWSLYTSLTVLYFKVSSLNYLW